MRVCVFDETFEFFIYICAGRQLSNNLIPHLPQRRPLPSILQERKALTYKKIIFFSVILFSAFLTFGQTEQQDIIVLRKAIGKTQDSLITYAEQSTGWKRIEEYFDKRKFKGQSPDTKQNSITLTKSEFKLLHQQIENYKDLKWEENLFTYSTRIPSDSVLKNLNERRKKLKEEKYNALARMDSTTFNNLKYKEPWVYGFSKPLYFRYNTFCLLYIVALSSGTSGYDEIAFYKKENENWSKWIVVAHGEFQQQFDLKKKKLMVTNAIANAGLRAR